MDMAGLYYRNTVALKGLMPWLSHGRRRQGWAELPPQYGATRKVPAVNAVLR